MNETFRDIKGFEGLYKIGNFGSVISLKKNKKLSHCYASTGYPKVGLYKDGIVYQKHVHRLVAEAFIENPQNKPQVNHIDGDKRNCSVENLEWVTPSENGLHAYRTGLAKTWTKGMFGKDAPKSKTVYQFSKDGLVRKWECVSDACREYGFDSGCITRCCQNKYNSHKGFVWSYTRNISQDEINKRLNTSRKRRIVRIDKNGNKTFYQSIADAEKEGFRHAGIISACKGRYKTSMGYRWLYA